MPLDQPASADYTLTIQAFVCACLSWTGFLPTKLDRTLKDLFMNVGWTITDKQPLSLPSLSTASDKSHGGGKPRDKDTSPSLSTASDKSHGGGKPRDEDTSPRFSIASHMEDWEHTILQPASYGFMALSRAEIVSKTILETRTEVTGQGYTIITMLLLLLSIHITRLL